jgi:heat shock protein HtpX
VTLFFIGFHIFNVLILIVVYTISISFALSYTGEKFMRFLENIRKLETKREKEYLIPIFNEVCNRAKSTQYKGKIRNIEIYIIDAMYINAFALGKRTVAVTSGAVKTLSEDELKGLIAHEMGHIVYGHTKALLLTNIGNSVFMFFMVISRGIINAMEILHSKYNKRGGIIELLIFLLKTIFNAVIFLLVSLGELILSVESRQQEYRADRFAFLLGYGTELVNALYLLQDMLISDKMTLFEKLKRSHPHIANRIGVLEYSADKSNAKKKNN